MSLDAITLVNDADNHPRVSYARDVSGNLTVSVELTGLEPDRGVSPSEAADGMLSFNPPTIYVKARERRLDTLRTALELTSRTVTAAIVSTLEATATADGVEPEVLAPSELLMIHLRVTMALRATMRAAGEEI